MRTHEIKNKLNIRMMLWFCLISSINTAWAEIPIANELIPKVAPAAPVISNAIPGNAKVTLNWTAVAGAVSYNVYQGTTAGGEAATPVKTGVTGVTVTITGLTNGTMYFFKMRAVNAGGLSALSNEKSARPVAPPAAPVISNAIPGNAKVTLNWTAVAGAAHYNVYQGITAGGEAATPVKTGVTGVTVTITGLTNGTMYFFKMRAVNAGGPSVLSNEKSARPVAPPAAPVIRNAVPGNAKVTLNWTAVAGAAHYNVYQGITAGGEAATPVKTGVTGVTVTITGLTNGTLYFFKMRAVNAGGLSILSNEKSARPVAPPPSIVPLAIKARIVDGLELVKVAKQEVVKQAHTPGELAATAAAWNASRSGKGLFNKYVKSTLINPSTGEITITFNGINIGIYANAALVFTPYIQSGGNPIQLKDAFNSSIVGHIDWGCASSTNLMSAAYGLPVKTRVPNPLLAPYAPLECK